jgi:hypothetical protein
MEKGIVIITVDAKKYFEADADRLPEVEDGDLVQVIVDCDKKTTEHVWYNPDAPGIDGNPANHPSMEDDFDAVVYSFAAELTAVQDNNYLTSLAQKHDLAISSYQTTDESGGPCTVWEFKGFLRNFEALAKEAKDRDFHKLGGATMSLVKW